MFSYDPANVEIWTPPPSRLAPLTEADKADLIKICEQQLDPSLLPLADSFEQRVPIYNAARLSKLVQSCSEERVSVLDELYRALSIGPGLFVVRGLIAEDVIDRAEAAANIIHKRWPAEGGGSQSMRTTAFIEKIALVDPETFAEYYGNEVLAAVAEAWLGPGYKIYADLNAVSRGNTQPIHRDYPVSHVPADCIPAYPIMSQMSSQLQTLQGAVAHTDMPFESGPTRLAPFSHQFKKGYMAIKAPEYIAIADQHMTQLPLRRGDAVIFNPACFHQPGVNTTDTARQACLFQFANPWTVHMVLLDRKAMAKSVWPVMKSWAKQARRGEDEGHSEGFASSDGLSNKRKTEYQLDALISATCDDFAYPFNWRVGKGAQTQAQTIRTALRAGWDDDKVYMTLDEIAASTRI